MEITSAEFVISNTDVKKCPTGVFPEYAFIGRSNVGKSSLINMLTARKGLAMTSATPGKTMLINHFLINQSWYLVDLPGYGYARRGQKGKDQIRTIIEDYILEREQMTNLFVLIDSRLEPLIFFQNTHHGDTGGYHGCLGVFRDIQPVIFLKAQLGHGKSH